MKNFIKNHFSTIDAFVEEHKLIEIENLYDEKNFGNAYLIVGNDILMFQFAKDRSQSYVNIKAINEVEWHQLGNVFDFLNISRQKKSELDELVLMSSRDFLKLGELFSDADKISQFVVFEKEKSFKRWEEFIGRK